MQTYLSYITSTSIVLGYFCLLLSYGKPHIGLVALRICLFLISVMAMVAIGYWTLFAVGIAHAFGPGPVRLFELLRPLLGFCYFAFGAASCFPILPPDRTKSFVVWVNLILPPIAICMMLSQILAMHRSFVFFTWTTKTFCFMAIWLRMCDLRQTLQDPTRRCS